MSAGCTFCNPIFTNDLVFSISSSNKNFGALNYTSCNRKCFSYQYYIVTVTAVWQFPVPVIKSLIMMMMMMMMMIAHFGFFLLSMHSTNLIRHLTFDIVPRCPPHPSLWCSSPSPSTICQPELSHCASLSTQHVRLSGVPLCRPDSLELAAWRT